MKIVFATHNKNKMKEVAAMDACKAEETDLIYVHRKDLEYVHPSVKDTELNFREWQNYEFKPGSSQQVLALLKEWQVLLKKHDVVRRHSVYLEVIGPKVGSMVLVISAKDALEYEQQMDVFWEKIGEEGLALWRKTEALMTNLEIKQGYFRPVLSMIPTPTVTETAVKN